MKAYEEQDAAIAALKPLIQGGEFPVDAADILEKSEEYLLHYSSLGLGSLPNGVNMGIAMHFRGIPEPGNEELLQAIHEITESYLRPFTIGAKLHRWMKQEMLSEEPNLIRDYMQAFVATQAAKARGYREAFDEAHGPLEAYLNVDKAEFTFLKEDKSRRQGYIDGRCEQFAALGAYENGSPLTEETLDLASNAFHKATALAENFADEFKEPLRSRLMAVDEKYPDIDDAFFVQRGIPEEAIPAVKKLFERFADMAAYGNVELEERKAYYSHNIGNTVDLLQLNFPELDPQRVQDIVQQVADTWFVGLALDASPPPPIDAPEGSLVLRPSVRIADSPLSRQIRAALTMPERDMPDDTTPGSGGRPAR